MKSICKQSASVISTGGGCVTVEENFDVIRQNAVVVWIKRPIEKLSTDGRPLSKGLEELKKMYDVRAPKYDKICDIIIDNNKDIESVAMTVINEIERFVKSK